MFIVAKGVDGQTIQHAVVETEAQAWDHASELMRSNLDVKRVIIFDRQFDFVNALSKPGYYKQEDDQIEDEDKQALITLDSL